MSVNGTFVMTVMDSGKILVGRLFARFDKQRNDDGNQLVLYVKRLFGF